MNRLSERKLTTSVVDALMFSTRCPPAPNDTVTLNQHVSSSLSGSVRQSAHRPSLFSTVDSGLWHATHSVTDGPEHSLHDAAHRRHLCWESANCEDGHRLAHIPSRPSTSSGRHERQSAASGPAQVAHDEWQREH